MTHAQDRGTVGGLCQASSAAVADLTESESRRLGFAPNTQAQILYRIDTARTMADPQERLQHSSSALFDAQPTHAWVPDIDLVAATLAWQAKDHTNPSKPAVGKRPRREDDTEHEPEEELNKWQRNDAHAWRDLLESERASNEFTQQLAYSTVDPAQEFLKDVAVDSLDANLMGVAPSDDHTIATPPEEFNPLRFVPTSFAEAVQRDSFLRYFNVNTANEEHIRNFWSAPVENANDVFQLMRGWHDTITSPQITEMAKGGYHDLQHRRHRRSSCQRAQMDQQSSQGAAQTNLPAATSIEWLAKRVHTINEDDLHLMDALPGQGNQRVAQEMAQC